jgi:hypothetical protein
MLVICEGLDRTGKTTLASIYKEKGFEIIHMSAPPKDQSSDDFLAEMIDIISTAAFKDIFLDRSYYGEAFIWPFVYERRSLLKEDDIQALREIEESVGVERVLMYDPNVEEHWRRCVENNEPLTKLQFIKARNLYYNMAEKYGFVKKTLPSLVPPEPKITEEVETLEKVSSNEPKTAQQLKLEKANAINEILSKKIIKIKSPVYDEVEKSIRQFLNIELDKLFGNDVPTAFNKEEVKILKLFCERLKDKETKK